ncbi:MAG: serine hydrolase, partial [Polyangiaceae bacterium]
MAVGVAFGLTSLGARTASAQCGSTNQVPRCTWRTHPGINTQGLANDIANEMHGAGLQGFSVTAFGEDGNPSPVIDMSFGLSQVPATGPSIQFDSNTISSLGSVSKLITEATVRHALEINWAGATGPYGACPVRSTSNFVSILPAVFGRIAHATYANVTIERLLNHEAGLETKHPYDALVESAATGTCQVGTECYSNINYQLATMLVPLIRDCSIRASVENEITTACASQVGDPARDRCQIDRAYLILGTLSNIYAQAMLTDKYTTVADCGPDYYVSLGANVARGFMARQNNPGGFLMSFIPDEACGSLD